jgi:predicted RNA binding protein YcfA (HicA-like mRNA interferase family)
MSKFPSLTGKEAVRLLVKKGWVVLRIRGSHHVLGHAESTAKLVLPVHGRLALKPGILREVRKALVWE